jgi:hypothetical protein
MDHGRSDWMRGTLSRPRALQVGTGAAKDIAVEPTPNSVRTSVAPAIGHGSQRALDANNGGVIMLKEEVML